MEYNNNNNYEEENVDHNDDQVIKEAIRHMEEHGWAVVKNLIPQDICERTVDSMWTWIESLDKEKKLSRKSPSSWEKNWPSHLHGIFQQHNAGHQQFAWDIRTHPNIIKVFETIWGTKKLLVSFDGVNFSKPHSGLNAQGWPHLDQSGIDSSFICVQGLLNLLPNAENDGGLMVYEDSHKYHAEFFKKFPERKSPSHWVKIHDNEEDKFYSDLNCKKKKICCNPGDFVIWDSRTVHYGAQPTSDKFRMVIYVSMEPRDRISKVDLYKKVQAFNDQRMTSHWAASTIKLFALNSRADSKNKKGQFEPPKMVDLVTSDVMLKLAGVKSYNSY